MPLLLFPTLPPVYLSDNTPAGGRNKNRQKSLLDSRMSLLEALSPQATLKRGYTITKIDGVALKSAKAEIISGTRIVTCLHDGEIVSIIK